MAVSQPTILVGPPSATADTATPGWRRDAAADRYVFSRRLRYGGVVYLVVTAPLCALLAAPAVGAVDYITSLAVIATVYSVPGLAVALVAAHQVTNRDRLVWRLWAVGFALVLVSAWLIQVQVAHGTGAARQLMPPVVGASMIAIAAANTIVIRSRSGQRAVVIDAVELLMATLAVVGPVALVVAEPIGEAPNGWFVTTMAIVAIGACHGIFVVLTVVVRLSAGERTTTFLALVLMVLILADSIVAIVQGGSDWALPTAPLAGLHAVCIGMAGLFFLWSERRPGTGLDRFPPQAQVRRHSSITLLVLVAVPVLGTEAWLARDDADVVAGALGIVLTLLALSSLRHLLSARETIRLYSAVERAAVDRGELLADVLGHVDADRHRVAAHLHRQAVALYTAMTSFTCSIDHAARPASSTTPTAVAVAAERMRVDLARQVDELRQVAIAIQPLPRSGGGAHRLTALVRAYVENLYGDGPRPRLTVDVDRDLALDWTTEAVVLRIVQEATHNVWRHSAADAVRVVVTATERRLIIEVTDDGVGFGGSAPGRGIESMRTVTGFIDGDLMVTDGPDGRGTRVRAAVEIAAPTPSRRPPLRLVVPDGQ